MNQPNPQETLELLMTLEDLVRELIIQMQSVCHYVEHEQMKKQSHLVRAVMN